MRLREGRVNHAFQEAPEDCLCEETQAAGLASGRQQPSHLPLPGFLGSGQSIHCGRECGPRQTPAISPQPSNQQPRVCLHSCSSSQAVPVSKGICLSEKKNVAERQEAPGAAKAASAASRVPYMPTPLQPHSGSKTLMSQAQKHPPHLHPYSSGALLCVTRN